MLGPSVPSTAPPPDWTDPAYVATVVGVLATGVLVCYAALARFGPTVDRVVLIALGVTLPATNAHRPARRWG
jgi:hypothetical protein